MVRTIVWKPRQSLRRYSLDLKVIKTVLPSEKKKNGRRRSAVSGLVFGEPEVEDEDGRELFEGKEGVGLEEGADFFGVEETVAGEAVGSEEVAGHGEKGLAPAGGFEGKVEGLLGAVGNFLGEVAGGEGAPDDFIVTAGDFLGVGEGEGEVDEAMVEKGGAIFEAVGHGVPVLADEGPIGEPGRILGGEEVAEVLNVGLRGGAL